MNDFQSFEPLIRAKSLVNDPVRFQEIINVTFHKYESKLYDKIHAEMWQSLPEQYDLITSDIKNAVKISENLRLLDIGCGTGLASQMLLNSPLGILIKEVHLLDTSAEMLKLAEIRAKKWHKKTKFILGDIKEINNNYDMIIISSVLHHIPNLPDFLYQLSNLQRAGGILMTIQDPSGDSLKSDILHQRGNEYQNFQKQKNIVSRVSLSKRIYNRLIRLYQRPDYIELINRDLIKNKIVKKPLTSDELWSVTDLHVGKGIDKEFLLRELTGYSLISYRTYGFFGELITDLDPVYQQKEKELINKKDPNGRNFCSAWIKNS